MVIAGWWALVDRNVRGFRKPMREWATLIRALTIPEFRVLLREAETDEEIEDYLWDMEDAAVIERRTLHTALDIPADELYEAQYGYDVRAAGSPVRRHQIGGVACSTAITTRAKNRLVRVTPNRVRLAPPKGASHLRGFSLSPVHRYSGKYVMAPFGNGDGFRLRKHARRLNQFRR